MLEGKTIAVVVPCFNEARQICSVLKGIDHFVDHIIVVDDASTDTTATVVQEYITGQDPPSRVTLLRREQNSGPGAAVVQGYRHCLSLNVDIAAVMDGDGQMDPADLIHLITPIAKNQADYAKGNRLFHLQARETIPPIRFFGNAFLSMLTKIASGYWHVADSQSGFVAISRTALRTIGLDGLYPRYGYPNDMLIHLNVYNFRVADIPIKPLYRIGERSNLKIRKVVPTISWMLVRRFVWRMWQKYVIHDFHPLVLFYTASAVAALSGFALFLRLLCLWIATGRIPPINALAWTFCMISAMQFGLFAMWFDMEMNRDLKVTIENRNDATHNTNTETDA